MEHSGYTGYIGNVSGYFDEEFESEWFEDEYVKNIVWTIDKTKVTEEGCLRHDILGDIPPQYLSSGCKALILLYKTDIKVSGDRLGDNCIPILLEIAEAKDVDITLGHMPEFPDKFTAKIKNNGKEISSMKEFMNEYIEVVYSEDNR